MPLTFGLNNSPNYKTHPELTDMGVREAINIAIDREQIVSDVFQGYAVPGGSLIYPEYTPTYMSAPLSSVTRNVARANEILDKAGYAKGPDGTGWPTATGWSTQWCCGRRAQVTISVCSTS